MLRSSRAFELFKVRGGDGETSIHLLILSPVLNDFWASMIVDLKTIKLFNLLSHGLHNRCGKDSLRNRGFPWIFSAAASSARFPLPNKFFQWEHRQTIYITDSNFKCSHQRTYRLFSVFSVDRYLTFHPLELNKSNDNNNSLSPLDWVATNFLLMCPSLKTLICNLPESGRHVTRPNQGLSSLAPGKGKRRGPGNEVDFFLLF